MHDISQKITALFSHPISYVTLSDLAIILWTTHPAIWQMQCKYGPLYENMRPISLFVSEYTWKMQQALSRQWIQLGNSTHRTKRCGKCLTCFWVTRVRRTAREAGTAGVSVWTAGTWGWEARGATHIHRLALLCNKQKRSDDIQKGLPPY